jgi:hypothetical protein
MKMHNRIFLPLIFLGLFFLNGCLLFHTVSYEITLNDDNSGEVTVTVNNIRSDAINKTALDEDKKNLFEFLLESDEFVSQMKDEGKYITGRDLFIKDNKLNGNIFYTFNKISDVEGIVYDEPYYFLTLSPEDSVIKTNGEVIISDNVKRIMWDNSIDTLRFTMFSDNVESGNLVDLTKYYKED